MVESKGKWTPKDPIVEGKEIKEHHKYTWRVKTFKIRAGEEAPEYEAFLQIVASGQLVDVKEYKWFHEDCLCYVYIYRERYAKAKKGAK